MEFIEQLEEEPISGLVRYEAGKLQDAIAFVGTLRKHPYDKDLCLLLADHADARSGSPTSSSEAARSSSSPAILEFKKADVQGVEELASPVDESGSSRQLVRLWVRRGSRGVRYEPFEVDEPLRMLGAKQSHVLSGARS